MLIYLFNHIEYFSVILMIYFVVLNTIYLVQQRIHEVLQMLYVLRCISFCNKLVVGVGLNVYINYVL